ncbi:glycosyltransferase family 2 protein [Oryzomonas rubra]|uniref:Glycosyltransferase family 2 protein n=1 Tax=Oryzomonas rubra TaxID=2509454 RepID=A0A5A9XM57_9BACT|nr:glycosyltransferase family 2 protein [Oryzomonas rubra]KAA0893318.1 glycosyltransferase family 2 protein [Oryzomonas rubra]
MPMISIIILTWNGKTFLQPCLDALAAQSYRDFETILVDNGSRDGSADYVRNAYPWVRLVELPENVGFAEGNNRGLAVAQGAHIVTLNNDTAVQPEFLAELVAAVEADPGIGMVAAKMLNFYRTGRIDSVGVRPTTAGLGINIGVGEADEGQYDVPSEVFGPCAGAALYRRAMLEEIGFFDGDFFAYYEDLDLAWRGRLAGWRAVTAPRAVVYHVHSATGGRMSPFTVYQVQRNKWYVLLKNWPPTLLLRHLPRILAWDGAALLLALVRGRFVPALRARLHVLRDLPPLLRKRREIARLRRLNDAQIAGLLARGASPVGIFLRKMGSGV